jgi:hypothetical protein
MVESPVTSATQPASTQPNHGEVTLWLRESGLKLRADHSTAGRER